MKWTLKKECLPFFSFSGLPFNRQRWGGGCSRWPDFGLPLMWGSSRKSGSQIEGHVVKDVVLNPWATGTLRVLYEMPKCWFEPCFGKGDFTAAYSNKARSQRRDGPGCIFLVIS